ncbi:response regulator [Sideroxydans sp. CL21]|uniref:response regulator n=1 Tax=Sideroxydans sp. CL21 TaxID=2600596 RepID=UPI0032D9C91A
MDSMVSILIVDDDEQIRQLLREYLAGFGMSVTGVTDGAAMEESLAKNSFDLVILDLMLPGEDGLSLCRSLRVKSDIPILMLTARGEAMDRVVGLEVGADDYIVKPFEPRELVARIQSILRRSRSGRGSLTEKKEAEFMGWRLDLILRQLVSPDQIVIPLSNAEFRLLAVLVEHPNRVLTREFLLDEARGRGMELFDRSIDILISRVRQKLNDDPRTPSLIKTVRGEGYLFDTKETR